VHLSGSTTSEHTTQPLNALASTPRLVTFLSGEPVEVVASITSMREDRSGWINFRPYRRDIDGDPDDVDGTNEYSKPTGSATGIGGLLLKPAPPVPECTWIPGDTHRRKGQLPDSIGLQHPSGSRGGPTLVAHGITLPDGWKVLADNARRGLVLTMPHDFDAESAVRWLLRAAEVLTPYDLPIEWVAEIHTTER